MTCGHCAKVRQSLRHAAKAAASGDLSGAAAAMKDATHEVAEKLKDEAARVRARLTGKR